MSLAAPRAGQIEELLVGQLPGALEASVSGVTRVFGGNARQAWAFHATWAGGDGPAELAGILLAQPPGGQLDSDPEREFRVLRGLSGAGVRIPGALAVDACGAVIGAPSVLLQRMPGTAGLSAFLRPEDPSSSVALTEDLAVAMAELHAADWRPTGLGEVTAAGTTTAPEGSPEDASLAAGRTPRDVALEQVLSWRQEFEEARPEPHPPLSAVFRWLESHLPEPATLSVVHGDLRPGNFLHEDRRITALLDWEMAHLGDPAEDVAWAYRPLWSPEAFVSLDDFIARYNARATTPVTRERVDYYRVLNEAKFCAISLRASHAFHAGASRNLRLADRAAMVNPCVVQALHWMEGLDASS